jgi:hypothetical protein
MPEKKRTRGDSLREARRYWKGVLKNMLPIKNAGLKRRELNFFIEEDGDMTRIYFSPRIMNLFEVAGVERGEVTEKLAKFFKRHGKKIALSEVVSFYKPEKCKTCAKAISVSKETAIVCAEGSFAIVSHYLDLLLAFLKLEERDEDLALDHLRKIFCSREDFFIKIDTKRKRTGIKIKILVRKKESKKYNKLSLFYSADGRGIRQRLDDIIQMVTFNLK